VAASCSSPATTLPWARCSDSQGEQHLHVTAAGGLPGTAKGCQPPAATGGFLQGVPREDWQLMWPAASVTYCARAGAHIRLPLQD
jgi:hypothetical protein